MPDLTANASTFRAGRYQYTGYLGTVPQTVVMSRAVNMATITYPVTQITFDNPYSGTGADTDVIEGMTVIVYSQNTSTVKGLLRVAAGAATATVLQVNEFSRGTLALADNDRFEVVNEYRIWDKLVAATANLEKDSRVSYVDQTDNYPPVANGGGAWFGFVDSGQTYATIQFDASTSFAVDPANTSGLTYAWDVRDGTITVGVFSDAAITATFPVGFRHVGLTVTDTDNSSYMIKRIPVYVYDASTAPLAVQMQTLSGDVQNGWRAAFRVPKGSEAALSSLPDGAFVCYFEDERYGDSRASYGSGTPTNRAHIKFCGYLVRDSILITPEADEVTFEAVGPLGILDQTGALPQLLITSANPANWQQAKTLTLQRALWYLAYWHSTALEYFDFIWPAITSTYSYSRITIEDTSSIAGQLRDVAQSINVDVTCDRVGRVLMRANPNYLSVSNRGSVTTTYNLTTADLLSVDFARDHRRGTKFVRGEGITTGGDPVFSNAPGNAYGEGSGSETFARQIIASQSELNQRTGDYYAMVNGLYWNETTNAITRVPRDVRLALPDGYDVFDPALREFVTLTLASSTNARAVAFTTSTKWTIESVNIGYDPELGSKDVEISLSHETHGPAGVTYIPPQASQNGLPALPDFDLNFPGFGDLSFDVSPLDWGLGAAVGDIAAFNADGYVYYTTESAPFTTPSSAGGPSWVRLQLSTLGVSGTVESFCVDAFSPGYTGTSGGAVNGWLVTTTGIYRITDIFGTIGATLQHTFASTVNLVHRYIDASFGFENWAGVASLYQTFAGVGSTTVTWTTDGGTTWTETTVTAIGADTVNSAFPQIGLHISSKVAGLMYSFGYNSARNEQYLYRSSNYGSSWSQISPAINVTTGAVSNLTKPVPATIIAPFEDNNGDVRVFLSGSAEGVTGLGYQLLFTAQVGVSNASNITPAPGAAPGLYQRSLSVLGSNRLRMAFLTLTNAGSRTFDLWTSTTGGLTSGDWTRTQTGIVDYSSLALVGGAASEIMYLWGNNVIGYSSDFGATIDSRRGNMPTAGRFVNICGKGS